MASGDQDAWSLSEEQRIDSLTRAFDSLCSLGFSNENQAGRKVVDALESKAYAAAQAQAATTTGARPKKEVTKAYARKLGELICEAASDIPSALMQNRTTTTSSSSKGVSLDLSGSREFLTKATAIKMLSALFSPNPSIEKVIFSMKSFALDAAEVAAQGLLNIKGTLRDVDISDTIAGRPESEALQVLRVLSEALSQAKLKSLNLSDNALGEKGLRACSSVIKSQTGLQRLWLRNVGCSDTACMVVDELLDASDLRGLFLYNNMSGDAGAKFVSNVLSRAPKLEQFQMGSSRVEAEGAIALCKGLCAGTTLVELDLSDNPITEEASKELAEVVKHQRGLRILNLNDTCLGDASVLEISDALSNGVHDLEVLELALNEITPDSAGDLGKALLSKAKLRRVNLRENELEDRGAAQIADGIMNSESLEELDLVMNMIGNTGGLAVARAVASTSNFRRLELDENQISEETIEDMQIILSASFEDREVLGSMEENDPAE